MSDFSLKWKRFEQQVKEAQEQRELREAICGAISDNFISNPHCKGCLETDDFCLAVENIVQILECRLDEVVKP